MQWVNWRGYEVNTIKVMLESGIKRKRSQMAEQLSNRLGMDIESVRKKIDEVQESERIGRLSKYANWKKDRIKTKAKRKIKGGM